MKEYDIAIIGAGIAGLYRGMIANPDKKVALFEASNMMEGRIETVKMDLLNAEYGRRLAHLWRIKYGNK